MAILGHLMTKSTCAQRRSREKILHLEMPVNMTTEGNGVPGPCPRKPPEGALFLSALSVPAGARAYTRRRPLFRGLRPLGERVVDGRKRADSRFAPSRNFARGPGPSLSDTPLTKMRRPPPLRTLARFTERGPFYFQNLAIFLQILHLPRRPAKLCLKRLSCDQTARVFPRRFQNE